jgi:hypothetical protein
MVKKAHVLFAFVTISAPAFAQGGLLPRDAINLSQATVYNSPMDIASWPVTAAITQLVMEPTGAPAAGLSFTFTA